MYSTWWIFYNFVVFGVESVIIFRSTYPGRAARFKFCSKFPEQFEGNAKTTEKGGRRTTRWISIWLDRMSRWKFSLRAKTFENTGPRIVRVPFSCRNLKPNAAPLIENERVKNELTYSSVFNFCAFFLKKDF